MKVEEYLYRNYRQEVPEWLANYSKGDPIPLKDFFNSRIVYYPGSGTDGHPLRVFGSSHSAHCFIYADYMYSAARIRRDLQLVKSYKIISIELFKEPHDLLNPKINPQVWRLFKKHEIDYTDGKPERWRFDSYVRRMVDMDEDFAFLERHLEEYARINLKNYKEFETYDFDGLFAVLERNNKKDDKHGPKRLAFMYLGIDAIKGYANLFCPGITRNIAFPKSQPKLFAMLLQDHGMGGNYAHFGKDSILEDIARHYDIYPELILSDTSCTSPWSNYKEIKGVETSDGDRQFDQRTLFERQPLK